MSAGSEVSLRTASSSVSALRSRTQRESRWVEKHESHSWLACAPASDSPIIVCGSVSSDLDLVLVVVQHRHAEAGLEAGLDGEVEHQVGGVDAALVGQLGDVALVDARDRAGTTTRPCAPSSRPAHRPCPRSSSRPGPGGTRGRGRSPILVATSGADEMAPNSFMLSNGNGSASVNSKFSGRQLTWGCTGRPASSSLIDSLEHHLRHARAARSGQQRGPRDGASRLPGDLGRTRRRRGPTRWWPA